MKILHLLLLFCCTFAAAQSSRQTEGIRTNTPAVHALKNLTIIPAPGKRIENGTIIIRDGVIRAVGANVAVPSDAREWDCTGLTAYAGMIDLASDYGQPKPKNPGSTPEPPRGPAYWNPNVLSDLSVAAQFMPDKEASEKLRAAGFTTVLSVPQQGIIKGQSVLVNLGAEDANSQILRSDLFQHITLASLGFGQGYPDSHMGAIALIRQSLIDAGWYADAQRIYAKNPAQERPEENRALAALGAAAAGKQLVVFETNDEQKAFRAGAIAKEFSLQWALRGSGYEYRRVDAVKALNVPVILPVNFPDAPSVASPEDALNVGYEELRHWDFASENPARLRKAGVTVALTAAMLKDAGKFRSMVGTAIDGGLSQNDALAAVTTVPAQLAGMEKQLGTLEPGKIANIVLMDGGLFSEKSSVRETWVEGVRYEVKSVPAADLRGSWKLSVTGPSSDTARLEIAGEADAPTVQMKKGEKSVKASSVSYFMGHLSFSVEGDSLGWKGMLRLSGTMTGGTMAGLIDLPGGVSGRWSATLTAAHKEKSDSSRHISIAASFPLVYPDGAFGRTELPKQQDLFVKNATIWTSASAGVLEGADMIVSKGKIVKVGKGLSAPSGALVIDAQGKHVTAGLIDAHSHTAISEGVNEAGQAVTAEVRIGDVVNADDINIYRQLAGGLTTINQLHGSANAMGGQNQVSKLRWGMLPEQMKFEGAIPGIKFALGENPKQSNWGERFTTRYPQTRMGVEQIIRDGFTAAREYEKAMAAARSTPTLVPPRRDLELETLVEILNKKRLIHSHCYRQDEILMLMKVSDDFGFQIGTLQHILEGYKVADEMAKRGIGASAFSDWWAYKYEVVDAIPYAGKLMHDAGVLVSYNSDSNEMARRMNLEAAKAVKYGGMSETDALNFVTINPAKQLRIDSRVGSLEAGKDADFVIWSGHPLSTYSICEQTWIEGRRFFDRAEDAAMRQDLQVKKAELIQKAATSKKKGAGPAAPSRRSFFYSCHEEEHDHAAEQEMMQ
ncbi:MAG: amidohydrolase family protein [Bacteroidetes bacterium]|nr:amidohydrolase family protein [Bacteroidota bacterium]